VSGATSLKKTDGRRANPGTDEGRRLGDRRPEDVARSPEETWTFLTSRSGLGEGAKLGREKGARDETSDGTTGELRSFRELDRVRLTWRPPHSDHDSSVQVTVRPRDDKR
jgi:hypothetical protein